MRKQWIKITLIMMCILGLAALATTKYIWRLYDKAYNKADRIAYSNRVLFYESESERDKAFKTLAWMGFKDYSKIDLSKIQLGLINLNSVNLENSKFRESFFPSVDLSFANLSHCDFTGAYLMEASLQETNLEKADFTNAYLYRVEMKKARLKFADFTYTFLDDCNLTPRQISKCSSIEGVLGLDKKFLEEVRRINPKLMEWWDGKSRKISVKEKRQFVEKERDEKYRKEAWAAARNIINEYKNGYSENILKEILKIHKDLPEINDFIMKETGNSLVDIFYKVRTYCDVCNHTGITKYDCEEKENCLKCKNSKTIRCAKCAKKRNSSYLHELNLRYQLQK